MRSLSITNNLEILRDRLLREIGRKRSDQVTILNLELSNRRRCISLSESCLSMAMAVTGDSPLEEIISTFSAKTKTVSM